MRRRSVNRNPCFPSSAFAVTARTFSIQLLFSSFRMHSLFFIFSAIPVRSSVFGSPDFYYFPSAPPSLPPFPSILLTSLIFSIVPPLVFCPFYSSLPSAIFTKPLTLFGLFFSVFVLSFARATRLVLSVLFSFPQIKPCFHVSRALHKAKGNKNLPSLRKKHG